jgi:hypothetical protein
MIIHEFAHGLFSTRDNDHGFFEPVSFIFQGKEATYFGGPKANHVNEVLEIHLPGAELQKIPIFDNHIELDNSLMSHQNYRNYPVFMEVELALLQDVGWIIDRHNFFGYSLYRDGQTVINDRGYFSRNTAETAYMSGTYNQEPYGIGLHVYGSRNTVTQKADILTEGAHAVGARIDGANNTLIIDKNIRIHSHGSDGIGVLFVYGGDHRFVLNGAVEANEMRGIGVSFDFGGNSTGQAMEMRGSYILSVNGSSKMPSSDLKGPLATSVIINGVLSGTKAALYMSETAYAQDITITPGATVTGDITSKYTQKDFNGNPYFTTLTFGPDENTPNNRAAQKFTYLGNIDGKNIKVHFTGAHTTLYTSYHIHSATIASGATLAGVNSFAFEKDQGLINKGTLSPNAPPLAISPPNIGRIFIDGFFQQTNTGKLIIDITKDGRMCDFISVDGKAILDGTLQLNLEPAFYPNSWIQRIIFLHAREIIGDFSERTLLSPTLRWVYEKTNSTYGISKLKEKKKDYSDPTKIPIPVKDPKPNLAPCSNFPNLSCIMPPNTGLKSALSYRSNPSEVKNENGIESENVFAEDLANQDPPEAQEDSSGVALEAQIGGLRASDAYSQYAQNDNDRAVGRVLDRIVDEADLPLQDLYVALDFSALDGSEVRSALAQLSPVAYGGTFTTSLRREQLISDTLTARPLGAVPAGQWQAFALPFVSKLEQKSRGTQVGYNTRTLGVVLGVEQQSQTYAGLTWGFHGVVGNKNSLTLKTADNANGSLQAWGLGMQMRYQPDPRAGVYLDAQGRIGLEKGDLKRTLMVGSYTSQQQGKWLGWTGTAEASGGYLWKLNQTLSLGPTLGLDYTLVTHPSITEHGTPGISLALEGSGLNSLRSSLGLRGVIALNQKLNMDLQARWDQELLSNTVTQNARVLGYGNSAFSIKTMAVPRSALNLSGQATYEVSPKTTLGMRIAGEFSRTQKPELAGNIVFGMRF